MLAPEARHRNKSSKDQIDDGSAQETKATQQCLGLVEKKKRKDRRKREEEKREIKENERKKKRKSFIFHFFNFHLFI